MHSCMHCRCCPASRCPLGLSYSGNMTGRQRCRIFPTQSGRAAETHPHLAARISWISCPPAGSQAEGTSSNISRSRRGTIPLYRPDPVYPAPQPHRGTANSVARPPRHKCTPPSGTQEDLGRKPAESDRADLACPGPERTQRWPGACLEGLCLEGSCLEGSCLVGTGPMGKSLRGSCRRQAA